MKSKHKWLSWISLSISILALTFTLFKIIPTVSFTGETYIGAIATLMGVAVTFTIGFQIYNVIEFKNQLNKVSLLERNLEKIQKDLEKKSNQLQGRIFFSQANLSHAEKQIITCIFSHIRAIQCMMDAEVPEEIDLYFNALENSTDDLRDYSKQKKIATTWNSERELQISNIKERDLRKVIQETKTNYKNNLIYQCNRSQFEKISDEILSLLDQLFD